MRLIYTCCYLSVYTYVIMTLFKTKHMYICIYMYIYMYVNCHEVTAVHNDKEWSVRCVTLSLDMDINIDTSIEALWLMRHPTNVYRVRWHRCKCYGWYKINRCRWFDSTHSKVPHPGGAGFIDIWLLRVWYIHYMHAVHTYVHWNL